MAGSKTYSARCHCGAVRFRFASDEITTGRRCNCSLCVRKGMVMSAKYVAPEDVEELEGMASLSLYQFGDRDVKHYFCKVCGICPFNVVAAVPDSYDGPAKPGDYRINLGCVDELDVFGLEIEVIDGRSF